MTQNLPAAPPAAAADAAAPAGASQDVHQTSQGHPSSDNTAVDSAAANTGAPASGQASTAAAAQTVFAAPVVAAQAPAATGGGPRMTGPWIAGEVYGVVPTGPLTATTIQSDRWYAITKGRYVGVTPSTAVADGAVSRVPHALRSGYTTQTEALQAFNLALGLNLGLIMVIA